MFLGRLEDVAGGSERAVTAGPLEAMLADLEPALAVACLDERVRIALNGELITGRGGVVLRSEEHTSELQSPC